jgi:Family of unknown function (DUF5677)
MNAAQKIEEVAKVRTYLGEAEAAIAAVGVIPRRFHFNKFDTIALAILSKAFSVARACLLLIESGFEDEAFGLCRSIVECAWSLRYLTQESEQIEKRTWQYINFLILDKQFWM